MADRYDIVALVSNDLVTDQRMIKTLSSLESAGYRCLLLGRVRANSLPLNNATPFDQERHFLRAASGKLFYWQLNRAHYKRLVELKPKAILVVDLDTMWAGARAAQKLNIPWVYDAHELFTDTPELENRPIIKAAWDWLARKYMHRAKARYTVGIQIANVFKERYGQSFEVVRNFSVLKQAKTAEDIPVRIQKIINDRQQLRGASLFPVIYQGALNLGRGLEELIVAASSYPALDFWIVGSGDLENELKEQGRKSPNVVFFGNVRPDTLRGITKYAKLGYGLMQNRGLNYYLSLSNKAVDYIHAEVPSLQMQWPEYESIHEKYGCYYLVEHLDIESIREAIDKCLSPTFYEFLEVGCMAAKRELNWENEGAVVVKIWDRILKA